MKFRFENLGVVERIDFDLSKKLSVFCGPNGTGKTYVSYALYGLLNGVYPAPVQLFPMKELKAGKTLDIELDPDVIHSLRKVSLKDLQDRRIQIVFGLSLHSLAQFKTSLLSSKEETAKEIKRNSMDLSIIKESYTSPYVTFSKLSNSLILNARCSTQYLTDDKEEWLPNYVAKILSMDGTPEARFLPVERNSIYTFSKELSLSRLQNNYDLEMKRKIRYPLPIVHSLVSAEDLALTQKRKSKYFALAEEIERKIVRGNVSVSDLGEILFQPQRMNEALPFLLSASLIKTLSGLIIYLKHEAKECELLIIDEPELNLHPDNQILLAHIFAKMVNAGIRLLISTHSDYIVRELNNMIMLSSKEIDKKEFGYEDDEYLNPEDVGAYLFNFTKENPDRVIVENLPVAEDGFEVATMDAAIALLNERSMNLYYKLKEN
jgi:predicted ATP-dependent endonuclease of OLD family